MNVSEAGRNDFIDDFIDFIRGKLQMNGEVMQDLGPSISLAVHDSDPVIVLGSGDLAGLFRAEDSMMELLGYSPIHPHGGRWVYRNMRIESTHYGDVYRNRIPDYVHGEKNFGLFKHIRALNVGLQFEDDGLRGTLKWKTSGVD